MSYISNKNFQKSIISMGMIVGSTIGGYIPSFWGDSFFSMTSLLFTALGGIAGIWLGYKINNY